MISGFHVKFYLKSWVLFCFFKLHFHHDSFSASIKSIIYKLLWIVGQLVSSAVFFVLTSDCFAAIFLTRWISICLVKNFFFFFKKSLSQASDVYVFFIFYTFISCSPSNLQQVRKNTWRQYLVHKHGTHHLLLRSQNNPLQVRVCKSSVKVMIVMFLVII